MTCRILALICSAIAFALAGCDRKAQNQTAPAQTLNLYIWSEYIPQTVKDKFTQRTGIKINEDNYDSNEVLLNKLQSGVAGYDLCVPSDYMIRILIARGLIQPLDRSKLPNMANIEKRFLDRPFDPGSKYAAPYLWGTTGLGYNKERAGGTLDSWDALFDERYAKKVLMLDDMRECFAVALKRMGKSLNEKDPAVLQQAADMLKKQKALVKMYNSTDYDNILAAGDVVLAHSYNGQIAKLAAKEAKFAYAIPKEGCTVSMDGLCIAAKARNVEAAHLFINFIHEPQINAEIVNGVNYASTNEAARKFVKPEILNNPWIYPPAEALRKCEFMEDIGQATELMDRLWTEIKAK